MNSVVLYDALFDVANPNQALMTQMTAQVLFVASSAKDAVPVPLTALRPMAAEDRPRGLSPATAPALAPAARPADPAEKARALFAPPAPDSTAALRRHAAGGGSSGRAAPAAAPRRDTDQ